MTPSHSRFPAIDGNVLLSCTRVMSALEKVGSQCLRTELRRDSRRFLEEIVNCLLSTVASRSLIGQGIGCCCPAIVVGGDDVAPFAAVQQDLGWAFREGVDRRERS